MEAVLGLKREARRVSGMLTRAKETTRTFASSPAVLISETKSKSTPKEILDYLLQSWIGSSGSKETAQKALL